MKRNPIVITGFMGCGKSKVARELAHRLVQAAGAGTELKKFSFSGYPRNIVVSKAGEIVYWRTTVKAWDKFEAVVREELAK